jgi:hypothetical protein
MFCSLQCYSQFPSAAAVSTALRVPVTLLNSCFSHVTDDAVTADESVIAQVAPRLHGWMLHGVARIQPRLT